MGRLPGRYLGTDEAITYAIREELMTTKAKSGRRKLAMRAPETHSLAFDSWCEAFDYCREANHPIVVRVTNRVCDETAKVYPSGTCRTITMHKRDKRGKR